MTTLHTLQVFSPISALFNSNKYDQGHFQPDFCISFIKIGKGIKNSKLRDWGRQ